MAATAMPAVSIATLKTENEYGVSEQVARDDKSRLTLHASVTFAPSIANEHGHDTSSTS